MKPALQIGATGLVLAILLAAACSTVPYAGTTDAQTEDGESAIPAKEKPAGNNGQETS
ncbi:hypothetical protein [Pontiella sp.]|uniref:hypothetical protein n=1 Tax=Pontiella sp. TaxID=2837462 RepID=UPI003562CB9F